MSKMLKMLCATIALVCAPGALWAERVSSDEAAQAVGTWLSCKPQLGCRMGTSVASVRTCVTTNGASYHVVRLAGGGFVVTSADTELEPVVAFSPADDLAATNANPLWVMLNRDFSGRQVAKQKWQSAKGGAASPSAVAAGKSAAKWARLLPKSTNGVAQITQKATGLQTVSDLRVAPLLKTQWNQEQDSYWSNLGDPCYNYYTPSNYPCGCVATATAQVMYYHRHPTAVVTPGTYACSVEIGKEWIDDYSYYPISENVNLTMQGGVYDWDSMPAVPANGTTLEQRRAIGKLTSDVGIACMMQYGEGGSGTGGYIPARELPARFQYANAVAAVGDPFGAALIKAAFIPNLDAKLPVLVGVDGTPGGHAIVADGYGYSLETFYVHFNMGWAGLSDAWYAPPDVEEFNAIDTLVYNIYPTGAAGGVICSGRVLSSADGSPVASKTVTATCGSTTTTTTTDAKGIYAFILQPGSYTIASSDASQSVTLTANVATELVPNSRSYYVSTPVVNNRYDCNLSVSGGSVDPPATTYTVTFDLGLYGTRTGGGELVQSVAHGAAAVAPTLTVESGWQFDGWDCDFSKITADLTVTAKYHKDGALPDGYGYTETIGDYTWTFSIIDGEAEIGVRDEYGNPQWQRAVEPNPTGTLTVPEKLGGCPVTRLGYCAVLYGGMTGLVLPDTLNVIGDCAFYNCAQLQSVVVPAKVWSIGGSAFAACYQLTSVDISGNVSSIGDGAFRDCSKLRNLTVSEDNAWFLSDDGVLYDKAKTDLYFWPQQKRIELPLALRNIRSCACSGNQATQNESLVLPSGVTNVSEAAFSYCWFGGVELNEGLVTIGCSAFDGNNFRYVVIPSTVSSIGTFENGYGCVFASCDKLMSVFFRGNAPASVSRSIYSGAPPDLVTFVRPDSVGWLTSGSDELPAMWPTSDDAPRAIRTWTTYPDVSFLVRFDLGEGATRVGGGDLEQTVYEGSAAVAPLLSLRSGYEFYKWSEAFGCVSNSMVVSAIYRKDGKLPDGYNYTEQVGDYTWTFSIIDGETEIGVRNEYGNEVWQCAVEPKPTGTLTVPETLGGCSVTRLGYASLNHCDGITGLELPETLYEIGVSAFSDCTQLQSVEIPAKVGSIGSWAFEWCYQLTSVQISSNVSSIGDGAFYYCSRLRNLTVSEDNDWFLSDDGVLYDKDRTDLYFWPREKHIELPATLRNVRLHACHNNYATQGETLTFPSGVTNIGYSAFYNCQLGGVLLNEGLVSIGRSAFQYNPNLRSVVMPSTLERLDGNVFYDCPKLSSVFFTGNAPTTVSSYLYDGTSDDLTTFVRSGSTGWQSAGSSALPETWPTRDEWGNGYPRAIRTWTTYPDVSFLVRFDLGEGATRVGGGDLEQTVCEGSAAVAPLLSLQSGYEFYKWSDDFGCVSNSMVVSAIYRKNGKLPDGYNYTEQVGDYTWTFSVIDGEAEIGARDEYGNTLWQRAVEPNPTGTLTVPEKLGGCPVTRLGYCAVLHGGMTGLVLPETLNVIGDTAFHNCGQLQSVVIPVKVHTIDRTAFADCYQLSSVQIPCNVSSIGEGAFRYCSRLRNLTVSEDNAWFSSDDGVLYDKTKTDLYFWPMEKHIELPLALRNIRSCACSGNQATQNETLVFPSGVTNVSEAAFSYCWFGGVELNEGLVTIGCSAFDGNNFRYVVIPSTVSSIGTFENGYGCVFASCDKLMSVFFRGNAPASVSRSIYSGAPPDLVTFVRPDSVGWLTSGSDELPAMWPTSDDAPRAIRTWTTYPDVSFLVRFDLGEGATRVGGGDLEQTVCEGSAAVAPLLSLRSGYEFYKWSEDFGCVSNSMVVSVIYRQNGKLQDGYSYTEQVGGYTWTFSIIDGEAEIGVRDEYGNSQWQRAVEPNPTGTLTVPEKLGGCPVTRLGYCAVLHGGMTGLVLPETLNVIGDYAFHNCSQLQSVVVPAKVWSIGGSAFASCYQLASVDISGNVSSIGEGAFRYCSRLRNLTVSEDNAWFSSDDGVLYDKDRTDLYFWPREKHIELPATLRNVRPYACNDNYSTQGETLTFPSGVTNIGYSAFYGCRLGGVSLNEGLGSIGSSAFQYNPNLRSVVMPST